VIIFDYQSFEEVAQSPAILAMKATQLHLEVEGRLIN
jgi:hypothetical protein